MKRNRLVKDLLLSSEANPSLIEMGEKAESKYATDPIRERTRVYKENKERSDGRVRRNKMREEGLRCRGERQLPSVGTRSALRS